jgi:colanic acid/amylovoran biosynthesis glycosyltransferase
MAIFIKPPEWLVPATTPAMELPILSTFHSGIPELVENNLSGYLVEERDLEDYANKMELISNWSRVPINREKVEMFFEKNTHQKSLENYYLEALNILKKREYPV